MTGDPHEEWDKLATAHALHALDPDEERLFAHHLAGCTRCAATVADTEQVMARLAGVDRADEPPDAVWAGIADAIASEPHGGALRSVPGAPSDAARLGRRRLVLRSVMAAAAAVVIAAAGVIGWRVAAGPAPSPSAQSQVRECQQSLQCRVVALSGREDRGPAARLLVRDGHATLVATTLAVDDPTRQTYVLWQLPRNGRPVGLAAFDVLEPGTHEVVSVRLALPYADTAAFAVSREPGREIPPSPSRPVAVGAAST